MQKSTTFGSLTIGQGFSIIYKCTTLHLYKIELKRILIKNRDWEEYDVYNAEGDIQAFIHDDCIVNVVEKEEEVPSECHKTMEKDNENSST